MKLYIGIGTGAMSPDQKKHKADVQFFFKEIKDKLNNAELRFFITLARDISERAKTFIKESGNEPLISNWLQKEKENAQNNFENQQKVRTLLIVYIELLKEAIFMGIPQLITYKTLYNFEDLEKRID